MFVTLLERKLLSYSQGRVGPNKVLFGGLLQPALDGVKLLLKELVLINKRDKFIFLASPLLVCVVILFVWILLD